jgi:hypothetical protein
VRWKFLIGAVLAPALIAGAQVFGQDAKPSVAASARMVDEKAASEGVRQLVEQLKRHPARPTKQPGRRGLYLMDLAQGDVTLIASEPDPGANNCGSPRWSHDGKRIIYDVMPEKEFPRLRIKAIDLGEKTPRLTDLGLGARPTFSPDDKRIAFLLHHNAVPGAEPEIWVMQADGSGRHLAGEFGMPLWSPDGRRFLVVGFLDPRDVKPTDLDRPEWHNVVIPGHHIFAWPSWADVNTLAAIVGSGRSGDTVALLDVSDPGRTKVERVLWQRGKDFDVEPLWPVFSASARLCALVGSEAGGMGPYAVEPSSRARRLESGSLDAETGGLAFSPDGRYLLFCSIRSDRK